MDLVSKQPELELILAIVTFAMSLITVLSHRFASVEPRRLLLTTGERTQQNLGLMSTNGHAWTEPLDPFSHKKIDLK